MPHHHTGNPGYYSVAKFNGETPTEMGDEAVGHRRDVEALVLLNGRFVPEFLRGLLEGFETPLSRDQYPNSTVKDNSAD